MRIRIFLSWINISFAFILLVIFQTSNALQECYDDGAEFCIYQEDILSVDLLPDSFLLIDQNPEIVNANSPRIEANGSIDEAFNAMGFHRKKMNEFLCHGFLAEQILSDVGVSRVKRRLETLAKDDSLIDYTDENNVTIHEKMLSDEGSSKYKEWLQKTTTLDDIYQHYAPHARENKISKKQSADRRYDDVGEEYDGAVTGYAMPAPMPTGKVGGYFSPSGPDHFSSPSGHHPHHMDYYDNHGDFYPQIHEEHIYVPNQPEYHHHVHHRPSYHHGKGKGHDLSLKDFFEIALTALAFLAFGLFVIQLIMNVTNASTATAAAFLQADIDGTRFKRETTVPVLSPLGYTGNHELNELSHRVLRSIEMALAAEQDHGNCLRRVLCEDNKQSRENTGGRRIWIPVWSLGMSWLSGRMLDESPWSTMLGSVKAAVLGLGGADCAVLFPDCDMKQEVTKSRRRRRRRRRRKKK